MLRCFVIDPISNAKCPTELCKIPEVSSNVCRTGFCSMFILFQGHSIPYRVLPTSQFYRPIFEKILNFNSF